MTWRYRQSTGELFRPNGERLGVGYSGAGKTAMGGRNNPTMEGIRMKGPIPRGLYTIGRAYNHPKLGPITMNLDAVRHDALGRSLFRIHGDNAAGDASNGCIILGRTLRKLVDGDTDKLLEVVE